MICIKNVQKKRGHFYVSNLSSVYETLLQDSGFKGLERGAQHKRLRTLSKGSYNNHAKELYKIMNEFYDENLPKIHSDVKSFFKRNFKDDPDYSKGEFLDIAVSIDGSYGHMGRYSRFSITFVVEVITGRIIDFEVTEKCTNEECGDKAHDYKDNGNCKFGNFHGSSGPMETHNAMVLFRRSTMWGFRYTTYISDGDAKVFNDLRGAMVYGPDIIIEKMECANHLAKRACAALHKFGLTWKPTSPADEPPAKSAKKNSQRKSS